MMQVLAPAMFKFLVSPGIAPGAPHGLHQLETALNLSLFTVSCVEVVLYLHGPLRSQAGNIMQAVHCTVHALNQLTTIMMLPAGWQTCHDLGAAPYAQLGGNRTRSPSNTATLDTRHCQHTVNITHCNQLACNPPSVAECKAKMQVSAPAEN
jgi:hypothetical protein